MRKSIRNLITVAMTVIITLAGTAGVLAFKDNQQVPPGTKIGGIDISGLKYSEARTRLETGLKVDGKRELVIRQGSKTMAISANELNIHPNIDASLEKVKDSEGIFASVTNRGGGTRELAPDYSCDAKKLEQTIANAAATFDRAPINARVYLEVDNLKRTAEVPGFKTDQSALKKTINERLKEGSFDEINVPGQIQQPEINAKQLEPIKDMLAVYVTSFTPEPPARAHNIDLSSQRINNTVLLPDAAFSLNQIVGERTAANGFQPAPVFQNGKTVNDLGGGLCQVATTLYNAAVAADLKITERQPHSLAVDYAEPGQDATVAWGQYDLKFVNTTGSPILITVKASGGKLQARIYGKETNPGREIKLITDKKTLTPKVEVITNSRLMSGQQIIKQHGSPGYQAVTYRVELKNGKEVNRTQVSEDSYQPRPWIIEVAPGTKPRPGGK